MKRVQAPGRRRPRAPRGEGERLRGQILDAAEKLLIETNDEEAVSIRAVADAVGVTPPSIYLHFVDKNELLFAVCERVFIQLDAYTEKASASASDPLRALYQRGRAYVQFGLDHPEHYRIMFMRKPSATPEGFQNERLRATAFDGHVEVVTRAIEAGVIAGEPVQVSIGLWAAVHGITSLLISKPGFPWGDVDPLVDHILQVQIDGLRR